MTLIGREANLLIAQMNTIRDGRDVFSGIRFTSNVKIDALKEGEGVKQVLETEVDIT